jgi:hypothetical protein
VPAPDRRAGPRGGFPARSGLVLTAGGPPSADEPFRPRGPLADVVEVHRRRAPALDLAAAADRRDMAAVLHDLAADDRKPPRFAVIAARFTVNRRLFRTAPDFSGRHRTFPDHAGIFPDGTRLFRTAPDFSGQPSDVSGRRRIFQDGARFFRLTARRVVVTAGFSRRPRVFRRDLGACQRERRVFDAARRTLELTPPAGVGNAAAPHPPSRAPLPTPGDVARGGWPQTRWAWLRTSSGPRFHEEMTP